MRPTVLTKLPEDKLTASLTRLRRAGNRDTALRVARTLVAVAPRSGKAQRYLTRTLISAPYTDEEVRQAATSAELMLTLYEDSWVSALYADVMIVARSLALSDIDTDDMMAQFAITRPQSRFDAFRRYAVHLQSDGDLGGAVQLAVGVARIAQHAPYLEFAHELSVRADDMASAGELEEFASLDPDLAESVAMMQARRLSACQRFAEALEAIAAAPVSRPPSFSRRLLDALMSVGQHREALCYLDTTKHNLNPIDEARDRFDILLALGEVDAAGAVINDVGLPPLNREVFRRRRLYLRASGAIDDTQLADLLREIERTGGSPIHSRFDDIVQLYFELNELGEVERMAGNPAIAWQLDTLGQYTIVLTHYARRRFDEALRGIDELRNTVRHWEAEKLRSRILLELGDPASALISRDRFTQSPLTVDEVRYFSLLQLGRIDEAFEMYLPGEDRGRLLEQFGSRAEFANQHDHVPRRAVVMQDGPGDEIIYAGLYSQLAQRSDELFVTCDPRLVTLLQRSFPAITFVPTQRDSSRGTAGFLASTSERRMHGPLFHLLSESAATVVDRADRVLLGRSVPTIAGTDHEPQVKYLAADESLTPEFPADTGRLRIGVVWRSEYSTAMRDIHYLAVDDLAAIADLDIDLVVLQHDYSLDELHRLQALARHDVYTFDDVDLRDDFEGSAALLVRLDAVVGVGTTMTELAGAVGTPTVMLNPTSYSMWRSAPNTLRDYWHARTLVVGTSDPRDKASCVVNAVAIVEKWAADRPVRS